MDRLILCSFVLLMTCFHVTANSETDIIYLHGNNWTVTANDGITRPAKVPGSIYSDLMRSGDLQDPYFRFNDKVYKWVGREVWTYKLQFKIPSNVMARKVVSLVLEGVDTVSMVTINGRALGHTRNMFVRYIWDVKPLLQSGVNTIAFAFESPVKSAARFASSYPYVVPPECYSKEQNGECHVNFLRKEQSSFSWDWGPSFPAVGIWRDIFIQASDGPSIDDLMVVPYKDSQSSKWYVNVTACTQSSYMETLKNFTGKLTITVEELEVESTTNVTFDGGHLCIPLNIIIDTPVKLWWPNGYGLQKLYNFSVTLTSDSGVTVSSKSRKFGFRQVELVQDPVSSKTSDGLTFLFRINGEEIFMKGSNWIPADSFQERITEEYLRSLLGSARDAHMNMLRVWGGGVYESDLFYDIADEYGIMLWQDMMFACALYPTDVTFLESVQDEITYQFRRLIHHPSIAIWAGSNENEAAIRDDWYNTFPNYNLYYKDFLKLYIDTIRPIVMKEDPSRPFVSSSPSNGIQTEKHGWIADDPYSQYYGDVHFYDYTMDSWNPMLYPVPRFMSEYGFQSWPSFSTLQQVSVQADWNMNSSFVSHRQHHPDGNKQLIQEVGMHLQLPKNSSNTTQYYIDFIYLTQINQAMSIKTQTEVYLRSQSKVVQGRGRTMGALYWQLNDIWQAPTWASIEYGGKWKMLHYYAQNFFSPRIISPYFNGSNVIVYFINQTTSPREPRKVPKNNINENLILKDIYKDAINIQMDLYSWDNMTPKKSWTLNVPLSNDAAIPVTSQPLDDLLSTESCNKTQCFLHFKTPNDPSVPSNFLVLSNFTEASGLQKVNFKVSVIKIEQNTFNVTLKVDAIAPFVWLDVKNTRGRFSDNGFLQVEPIVSVKFFAWEKVDIATFQRKLTVQSLMDIY